MKLSTKSWVSMLGGISLLMLIACGGSGSKTIPPPTIHNEWTWMTGADVASQPGVYGTQGMPATTNTPGARVYPCWWTDRSGNFWLFGGYGFDSNPLSGGGYGGDLNDLWRYSNGEWTWVGGGDVIEQQGAYGTLGVSSPSNVPGGRWEAVSFTDASGNFWLFGGLGLDSVGTRGQLNDLWRYSNGQWTWMGGSNLAAQPGVIGSEPPGVYGTKGVPSAGNVPGARMDASTWADPSGNLWLFGGEGLDSNANFGILNDLWRFSNGEWTWVSGSNTINQFGAYGTIGTPGPANIPGARTNATTWVDATGNLWLFGGFGNDVNGLVCQQDLVCLLNDLWKYSNGEWTWMGGSDVANQYGIYGTQGTASQGNFPGARQDAAAWVDMSGNVWLFGGHGFDSTVGPPEVFGDLNDLWTYSNGEWAWMSGSNFSGESGAYGTKGTPASGNVPGARLGTARWLDSSGNLWLFGGEALFMPQTPKFNDLWKYQP
jgi:N-acetylneuraminic acid mutarotase